jgi:hypothetical protein
LPENRQLGQRPESRVIGKLTHYPNFPAKTLVKPSTGVFRTLNPESNLTKPASIQPFRASRATKNKS